MSGLVAPNLRHAVCDERRVLVGFDRGGWFPALFKHMRAHGFDILTWRTHRWEAADTMVEVPVGAKKDGEVVAMRQITRLIDNGKGAIRQIHLLTTRTDLSAGELLYRMGSHWWQENHFRHARMHFDLDAHDSYTVGDDDPERRVPYPAKKTAPESARRPHPGTRTEQSHRQQRNA